MEMRAATLDERDDGRRTHAQIAWESKMVDQEKLSQLEREVQSLRKEIEELKAESRIAAEFQLIMHQRAAEAEGH